MAKNKHKHEREDRAEQTLHPEEAAAKAAAEAAAALAAEEGEASEPVKQEAEETADKAAGAEIEALTDRLKRTLAEFENFRKRSEREKAQMFDLGAKSVLEKLLPVIDNFERSVAQAPESEDPGIKSYAEGMEMIYRQLLKNMKEAGVEPFDPNYHNAVMHEENEELGENVVAEELQKGYLYKDSVLRHSMVKVAN